MFPSRSIRSLTTKFMIPVALVGAMSTVATEVTSGARAGATLSPFAISATQTPFDHLVGFTPPNPLSPDADRGSRNVEIESFNAKPGGRVWYGVQDTDDQARGWHGGFTTADSNGHFRVIVRGIPSTSCGDQLRADASNLDAVGGPSAPTVPLFDNCGPVIAVPSSGASAGHVIGDGFVNGTKAAIKKVTSTGWVTTETVNATVTTLSIAPNPPTMGGRIRSVNVVQSPCDAGGSVKAQDKTSMIHSPIQTWGTCIQ